MKKIIYILITFALAINFSSCSKSSENKTLEETPKDSDKIIITKAQFENSGMKLENLTEQSFPTFVKVTGTIDVPPQNKEIISSFSGGYIKKSSLLIGDKVKKGQALVTLENPDFVELQQEYLEIVEQINYLKSDFERQKILFEEKITSQKKYLKAESNYKTSLARVKGIRKKLLMLNINPTSVEQGNITSTITLYASIGGSITNINVSKGTYVSPADVIMEIVNTDHIHLELAAFEKDLMDIKVGQHINFKIPEASEIVYKANVHLVGTSIDINSRTAKIHGHLHDDEKNNFAIGMFVDAEIETANKKSLAIQENDVVEIEDKVFVLKPISLEKDTYIFKTIEIKIGKKHNGYYEILSTNLKPSDKILINGAYDLIEN